MKRRIYLIRHGLTQANNEGVYAGRAEDAVIQTELSAFIELARHLKNPVSRIVSSPQRRAAESAKVLAASLGLQVHTEARFSEMEMGPWTGLRAEDIEAKYPAEWRLWRTAPFSVRMPGFEGLGELQERSVGAVFDHARRTQSGESIVIVSHETVIKVLLCWAFDDAQGAYRRLLVPNSSVSSLELDENDRPLVRSLNEFVRPI